MYIGSSINVLNRWSRHKTELINEKHHSIKLQRSVNKYGIINFTFNIIIECCENELIKYEQYYIDLHNSYNNGYNSVPNAGNNLGYKASDETKLKMSIARKGKKTGLTMSDEQKKKLITVNKGNKYCLGRVLSDETKNKISIANEGNENWLGKAHTNESKVKISETRINKSIGKGKNNPNYKPRPILQYDKNGLFIKEWEDLVVIRENGLDAGKISCVCRSLRKTYGGYKWVFK